MENTQKPIKATLDNTSDDSVKTQKPILIQLDDIPTPTEDDNGKILGVDEGKYTLVQGGGGISDDFYIIHLSYDDDLGKIICDHTYAEINDVWSEAQKIIIANYYGTLYYLNTFQNYTATFICPAIITTLTDNNEVRMQSNKIMITSTEITEESVDFSISVTFN